MFSKARHIRKQRGYALPEVLIATIIAAGVLAAAASAVGSLVRLNVETKKHDHALYEAKLIAARIQAGMADSKILEGLEDWRLERSVFEEANLEAVAAPFEIVTAAHLENESLTIEFLSPATNESAP